MLLVYDLIVCFLLLWGYLVFGVWVGDLCVLLFGASFMIAVWCLGGFSSLICAFRLAVCRLRVLSVMFAFLPLGLIDLVGG